MPGLNIIQQITHVEHPNNLCKIGISLKKFKQKREMVGMVNIANLIKLSATIDIEHNSFIGRIRMSLDRNTNTNI